MYVFVFFLSMLCAFVCVCMCAEVCRKVFPCDPLCFIRLLVNSGAFQDGGSLFGPTIHSTSLKDYIFVAASCMVRL